MTLMDMILRGEIVKFDFDVSADLAHRETAGALVVAFRDSKGDLIDRHEASFRFGPGHYQLVAFIVPKENGTWP